MDRADYTPEQREIWQRERLRKEMTRQPGLYPRWGSVARYLAGPSKWERSTPQERQAMLEANARRDWPLLRQLSKARNQRLADESFGAKGRPQPLLVTSETIGEWLAKRLSRQKEIVTGKGDCPLMTTEALTRAAIVDAVAVHRPESERVSLPCPSVRRGF
jgi:hypothetical protein